MIWLLANLRTIGYVAGAVAIIGVLWLVSSWRDDSRALGLCESRLDVQTESIKQNNEATNEYQKKIRDINTQFANLKRVQPTRCIPVQSPCLSGNASGISGSAEQSRGLSAGYLEQIARDLKLTAVYVDACSKNNNGE